MVGLSLLFIALGVYCLLWALGSRLTLAADSITIQGAIKTKVLSLAELRGWRFLPTSPVTLALEPKEKRSRSTKVSLLFPLDEQFTEWLATFPNLDEEEAEASASEILNDDRIGNTPSERVERLQDGTRRARVWNGIAIVAVLWAMFYPRPYAAVMLALIALPWIALEVTRRSDGLFRLDQMRNDAHPSIPFAFISALPLLLRAVLDFNVLQSWLVAVWSIAITAVLVLAIVTVDRSVRRKAASLISLCMFACCYGYGTTIELNAILNRSVGETYSAAVEGKRVISSKRTSYELELGPWGPKTVTNDFEVRKSTYEMIQPGDTVLLTVKTGPLRVKWYSMRSWQHGSGNLP